MPRSHEELTQLALNLVDADRQVQWGIADYALEDKDGNGLSADAIASAWGMKAATVNKLIRAARLFPREEDRLAELSFSHFVTACATTDPHAWIAKAADQHWSTRDLADEIKVAKAADPAEAQRSRIDSAIQRLRKLHQATDTDAAQRQYLRQKLTTWLAEVGWPR